MKTTLSIVLLGALLCFAFAQTDEERLLLAIKKPEVTNYTDSTITVGWYTGPNGVLIDYLVKCVPEGEDCSAAAAGVSKNGTLPRKYAYGEAQITGLNATESYTCYVAASLGKLNKCIAALPTNVTTLA